MVRFKRIVPLLKSRNIQETIDFYHNRLGFSVSWQSTGDGGDEICMMERIGFRWYGRWRRSNMGSRNSESRIAMAIVWHFLKKEIPNPFFMGTRSPVNLFFIRHNKA